MHTCAQQQAELLAEVRALSARVDAALAALRPAPPVDLVRLLRLVHERLGDAVWTVRQLHELAFVKAADTHRLGRELGKLHRQGGHFDGLQLYRVSGKQDRQRDGVIWKVAPAGCDDPVSSPHGLTDTMRALNPAWRS